MSRCWTCLASVAVLLLGMIAACQSESTPEVRAAQTQREPGAQPVVPDTSAREPVPDAEVPQEKPKTDRKATPSPQEKPPRPKPQEKPGKFDANAFPPTVPDTAWHKDAWFKDDCLRCHETGVAEAPPVIHKDLPKVLMTAKCRSCHVLIPGTTPRMRIVERTPFDENAFPPMIPASASHRQAWTRDDCLLCHDSGVAGAPIVVHQSLPKILLKSKCRTCHVQVRVLDAPRAGKK